MTAAPLMTMRARRGAGGDVVHFPARFAPPPDGRVKRKPVTPDPIRTNGESAAEQLRLFVERLERLREEQRGIADDIRDVLAEAKGTGFDPKALRAILTIRRQDREAFAEHETILDLYRQHLGML